jgi:hypothetical protein
MVAVSWSPTRLLTTTSIRHGVNSQLGAQSRFLLQAVSMRVRFLPAARMQYSTLCNVASGTLAESRIRCVGDVPLLHINIAS